jgi:DNA-binding MarR family transcriptional regulator
METETMASTITRKATRIAHAPQISGPDSHLGYWLRYVSNHVSYAFARKLEKQEVTVAEWVIMRELYDLTETAPSRLAERLGMTRGAVSKLAERLVVKALLRRRLNPQDGRAQTLALTAAGRRLVPRLAVLADENDAEFFDHLDPKEHRMIKRILKDIVECRGLKSAPID